MSTPDDRRSVMARLEERRGALPRVSLSPAAAQTVPAAPLPAAESANGRYRAMSLIATDRLGTVLLCRDVDLGREVAMKVLRDEHAGSADAEARFLEEAQIAGQLQHPGIVPVYELGRTPEGRPFFTMKRIQGRTLAALLAARRDPSQDRRRFLGIFESVARTLAYAHARGVIHRDVRPSNVVVGAFGEVQVADWGAARVLDAASGGAAAATSGSRPTASGAVAIRGGAAEPDPFAGSPSYMAPEQARGEAAASDERADVFSLGAILCEILTGAAPYAGAPGEAREAASRADLAGALGRLAACGADEALVGLCASCLAAARDARPRDAAAVAKDVSLYLASLDERARAAQVDAAAARARAREARRSRRLTVAIAATAVAAIALAAFAVLWTARRTAARDEEVSRMVQAAIDEVTLDRSRAPATSDASAWRDAAGATRSAALWQDALAAARRAAAVAESQEAEASVRARTAALVADVDRVARRAEELAAGARRDEEMAARLDELAASRGPGFAPAAVVAGYAAAFRDYGIDAEALPAGDVAARSRASALAIRLAVALDEWAALSAHAGSPPPAAARAAAEIDPDPFRTRLRAAAAADLAALAAATDAAKLPALDASLLAERLGDAGDADAAVDVATDAVREHPDDFRAQTACAVWLLRKRTPRAAESLAHTTAALALRPRSAVTWIHLAAALAARGDANPAAAAIARAAELAPAAK